MVDTVAVAVAAVATEEAVVADTAVDVVVAVAASEEDVVAEEVCKTWESW